MGTAAPGTITTLGGGGGSDGNPSDLGAFAGVNNLPATAKDGQFAYTGDGTKYVMSNENWKPDDWGRDWTRTGPQAPGSLFSARSSAADNAWHAVCHVPSYKRMVAVGYTGTGSRVMTSDDGGVSWTTRPSAADLNWLNVCYDPGFDRVVAVAASGTGNRVMTSDDGGATWTSRSSAADLGWIGLCYDPKYKRLVAVAYDGTGNQIMTSDDGGTTWVTRTTPNFTRAWSSICWDANAECLVAVSSATILDYQIMYSSDGGVTWTTANSPVTTAWRKVVYVPTYKRLVAVGDAGSSSRVMTSDDGGATWTVRTSAGDRGWTSVVWIPKYDTLIAVANAGTGTRAMVSYDGGVTWAFRATPSDNNWRGSCYDPDYDRFVSVATSGTGNRVMTSGSSSFAPAPPPIVSFPSYAAVVAALPPGTPGRMASIPMIGGPGRAILVDNGSSWVLKRGQMIVDEWVDVTSVGTSLVVAKTWELPAGLFVDLQEMVGLIYGRGVSGYVSGTDSLRLRNEEQGVSGYLLSAVTMAGAYPRVCRGAAEVHRDGSSWIAADATNSPTYNNAIPNVRSHTWTNPWTLGLTVQAGAAGHVMRINVKFGRV